MDKQSDSDAGLSAARERMKERFEQQFKGVNYLLIAHAVGLVTCLTLLKDYDTIGRMKGIGLFVQLFGPGLMFSIIAYVTLMGEQTEIARALDGDLTRGRTVKWLAIFAGIVSFVSMMLLMAAIGIAVHTFGTL